MGKATGHGWRLSRVDMAVVIGLCVLCLAAYRNVPREQFVPFDDDVEITTNPHIREMGAENLAWMFSDTSQTQRYTPLSWVVWAVVYRFWGLNPAAFHTDALLFHLINTVLLFMLVRSILRRALTRAPPAGVLSLCAGLGTALWAAHPMRVEVVSWATQARFAEAACFVIAAALLYFSAVDEAPVRPYRTWYFWGSAACFTASILFYPSGIGLAALLPLLDIYPLRRVPLAAVGWRDLRRFVAEKAPFFLAALFVGAMTIYGRFAAAGAWKGPASLSEFGLGHRLMQAAYVFIYYLWKPFDPTHISAVYTQLIQFDPVSAPFVLSLLGLIAFCGAAVVLWKRYPQFSMLWAAHLALIFPVGGYFEHPHFPSDRYSYLEGMLWAIVAASLVAWMWGRVQRMVRWAVVGGAVVIILAMTILSAAESTAWKNGQTLYQHMIVELGDDPYRAVIYWRLGNFYKNAGHYREAVNAFDESLMLRPGNAAALHFKADTLLKMAEAARAGNVSDAEDRRLFLEAGRTIDAIIQVGGGPTDIAAAGYAYGEAGDFPEALARLKVATELSPENTGFHFQYGKVLFVSGHRDEAMGELDRGIRLAPQWGARRSSIVAAWEAAARAATGQEGGSR